MKGGRLRRANLVVCLTVLIVAIVEKLELFLNCAAHM